MAEVTAPGVTLAQAQAMMPKPATSAPPPVAVDSALGSNQQFALADHTHESRLQARRLSLTFDANGEAVYVFPKAYPAGIVPIVEVTAENARGASFRNDASILDGSTTNTQTTIVLTRVPRTITVSILGAVISLFTNSAVTANVNIMSRAPS